MLTQLALYFPFFFHSVVGHLFPDFGYYGLHVNILTCLFVDISQSFLLGVYSTVKLLDHKYTNLALVNPAR